MLGGRRRRSVGAVLAGASVGADCVMASDIDVRWLGADTAFEVLRHDVVTDARLLATSTSSTPASS